MSMQIVPAMHFAVVTRQGRVAIVLEAESRPQAERRLAWLRSHAEMGLPPAFASSLERYDANQRPVPDGALFLHEELFEEADVY